MSFTHQCHNHQASPVPWNILSVLLWHVGKGVHQSTASKGSCPNRSMTEWERSHDAGPPLLATGIEGDRFWRADIPCRHGILKNAEDLNQISGGVWTIGRIATGGQKGGHSVVKKRPSFRYRTCTWESHGKWGWVERVQLWCSCHRYSIIWRV